MGILIASRARHTLVVGLLSVAACSVERTEFRPPMSAGALPVYQGELFYQKIGTGRPIVVVHGGPGLDHSYLRPWLEPLAETYQVVLYDQRGLGGSNAVLDAESISMTRFLTDLDRIRERVAERERALVLAHSWGAIPALLYAIEAPERIDGLILVNPVEPGARYQELTDERVTAARDPADTAAIDSLQTTPELRRNDVATLNRLFFHVFRGTFSDPAVADSLLELNLHERTARQGQRVASLLMTPLQNLDFWDRLPEIDAPVLIVHGADDPIPVEMVRELDASLPQSELVIVEGAGHFPFIERPGRFFGAIQRFVDTRVDVPDAGEDAP